MCRLTAIITRGDPLLLADILTRPRRSIIQQSFNCHERLPQTDIRNAYQKASLNGDGFGVGWYTHQLEPSVPAANLSLLRDVSGSRESVSKSPTPDDDTASNSSNGGICSQNDGGACVFTSLKPAWADRNLYNLAKKISSRLFFAHIRAASSSLGVSDCSGCDGGLPPWAVANGSVSTELCCHPFRCGRFLFMHNGSVGGFNQIRRDLLSLLPDPMFSFAITNSCIDSVCLFAVFLALLPAEPTEPSSPSAMKEAVEQMISTICWLLDKEQIDEVTLINIVVSDGECIVATRFVTNAQEVAYESGKSTTAPTSIGEISPAMPASLYFATGTAWKQEEEMCGEFRMTHRDKRTDICIVTSEPLTSNPEDWMPVPRNTMILITPAIDLLLYPVSSVGYLPPLFRQRRRPLSSVPPDKPPASFDRELSLRKNLMTSLADRLDLDFASLLEMCSGGPKKIEVFCDMPLLMLRSLEGVIRVLASGLEVNGGGEEGGNPWTALERKLQALEKQLRTAQAEHQQPAPLEDIRDFNRDAEILANPGLPTAALCNEELGFETTGTSQHCYELIAGSCAILCLESITVCLEKRLEVSGKSSDVSASDSTTPVAAKTFVFVGMQSGVVVVYDATSASVAPISFQAHSGGVLAMAVHASPWTSRTLSGGRITSCEDCGSALPEVFLVTGGSDTSLAVWDLSPLLFGGREPRLLSGTPISIDGPRVSISADDLLAVRLKFLPHQGDVLSLLVASSSDSEPASGCCHDTRARICRVEVCDTCLSGMGAAMRLEGTAGRSSGDKNLSPVTSFSGADLIKIQSNPWIDDSEDNLLLFIGFQSAKIGALMMSDLLRYFRHTKVMVSVLANAVSFQPTPMQALPLRVSRDFELKTLASGQVRVTFSNEQERESLRSLFTQTPSTLSKVPLGSLSSPHRHSSAAVSPSPSPCQTASLAADESFRSLLADFARKLRSVTLHASHAATTFWPAKWSRSGRPGCLYPPTGTIYCYEAARELEVPLPEGAAASASPGTYRVVTSTSSLKIVAQPSNGNGLKIEMRFLPFEQCDVKRLNSHQSLVGPWLDECGHNGFVECLICCGKKVICSGGGDGRLLLWGEDGNLAGELSGHHGGVLCVAYTEAPLDSPCRELRKAASEKQPREGGSPEGSPRCSEDAADYLQGLLFSGSRDNSIRVWALEQLVCIQTLNAHTSEVLALAADASRNLLISGSANGELFVWQLDLMVVAFRLSLNPSPCNADSALFPGVEGRHAIHPRAIGGQAEAISFTDILLISDLSSLRANGTGSAGRSPGAMTKSCIPAGLQLWAGRGDGKLGVWNLSERYAVEDGIPDVTEDLVTEPPLISSALEASDVQLLERAATVAGALEQPLLPTGRLRGHLGAAGVRAKTFVSRDTLTEGQQLVQLRLSSRRPSGVIVSPGASMPSLPSLTAAAGLEPRRSDFLPLLAQFVSFKSVSCSRSHPYVTGCIGAAKFVAKLFEQALGANVDIVWPRGPGASEFQGDGGDEQPHPVVFGRLGTNPQHPTIVFYSHYDVVPAESASHSPSTTPTDLSDCPPSPVAAPATPSALPRTQDSSPSQQPLRRHSSCEANATKESRRNAGGQTKAPEWRGTGWNTNPWKVHCKDGYIYGRGVTDNKGPIICSLLAVKQFIAEWRRKHRGRQTAQQQPADANTAASQGVVSAKNDPAVPFNFVWICEGDVENGSMGLADAVAQKASWLQGARFLICNNSYWADDTTPCLVYGMRGVLDIRVEATNGASDTGHHSGLHGGAVEEPMQTLVYMLGRLWDPASGRVTVPHFYDFMQAPDIAELQRVKTAAQSVTTGLIAKAGSSGMGDPEELFRKSWLEPSLSLLGISTSSKGKCTHSAGATRVIPSTACAEINLRLVPKQSPKEVFALIRNHLQESFRKTSSGGKLTVQCLRQGRPWRADLEAPRTRALYGAAHEAIKEVWGVDPLYVREGGSMPAIPFLADVMRRLPGPRDQRYGSDEVAVCQLPFGQASDNAHLPNERLGIRQVEKGVDVLACTLEALAVRLAGEASKPVATA